MKRRVTTFLVCLSALLCLAAVLLWVRSSLGWYDNLYLPAIGEFRAEIASFGGGVEVTPWLINPKKPLTSWDVGIESLGPIPLEDRVFFSKPNFRWSQGNTTNSISRWFISLEIPYWLLILLFAIAPALWWRRDYVARREKKLLGEAVAQKRTEHPHLDIKEPKSGAE